MKSFSIRKRLLILFGIILLPVILIGIGGQWLLNRTMTDEILTSFSNRISDSAIRMNDTFLQTNNQVTSLLHNERAKRVANPNDPMDNYDRSVNVNVLRSYLNNIKTSNPFVNSIRLYFPLIQLYYNADNVFDYKENRMLGSQEKMPEGLFEELLSFQDMPGNIYLHNGNLIFLQYYSPSRPDIIIETVYTPEELQVYLQKTLLYEESFYYFLTDYDSYMLTNCTDSSLNEEIGSLENNGTYTLWHDGIKYYAVCHGLPDADSRYVQVIPSSQLLLNLSAATRYTVVFTIVVLFCMAFIIIFSIRIIRNPIAELGHAFSRIENHDFDTRLGTPPVSDFNYLYSSFNSMAERLDTLIQKELRNSLLLQKSRLKQLQAQINPHFLYNSFFMLNQMLARGMNDTAGELTRELGIYFKYITRNYQNEIPLTEEYQHAAVYARLQSRRFEGRITLTMDPLPEEYSNLKVPRLILQPILENAFQHGMAQKTRDGIIQMMFYPRADSLEVCFEDNGETLTDEVLNGLQLHLSAIYDDKYDEETTGLFNIAKRLQLYYQQKNLLLIERSEMGGLQVSIKLLVEVK